MRMETLVRQVENDPGVINADNEFHGHFGWSVMNVQVTEYKNSRFQSSYTVNNHTTVNIKTEHVNYATITYQRDKDMPHYAELAALFDQARNCLANSHLTTEESRALHDAKEKLTNQKKNLKRNTVFFACLPALLMFAFLGITIAFPGFVIKCYKPASLLVGVLIVLSLVKSYQIGKKLKQIGESEEGIQVQAYMLTDETRRQTALAQIIAKANAIQRT